MREKVPKTLNERAPKAPITAPQVQPVPAARRPAYWRGAALLIGVALIVGAYVVGVKARPPSLLPANLPCPTALAALLAGEPAQLNGCDIALLNLACAEGLPGAENLDVNGCLKTLHEWAKRVGAETQRNLHRFQEKPEEYNNSEGYFRILMLVCILQADFDVRYNPDRIRDVDFKQSQDLFIHGMVVSKTGGTCVSMPVLYTAVARRLGYPVSLVLAKGHVLARWESADGKERFNIEGTNRGLNCFDDDYYKTWPLKMTPADLKSGQYLKSLTPPEEFAVFLAARGHCLQDTGRLREAEVAYAHAHRMAPQSGEYLGFLADAVQKEIGPMRLATGDPRENPRAPRDPMEELRRIEAMNAQNRRLMVGAGPGVPQPQGVPLPPGSLAVPGIPGASMPGIPQPPVPGIPPMPGR